MAWAVFATANVVSMVYVGTVETVPFHLVWISLTILYGLRVWSVPATMWVLAAVCLATGAALAPEITRGEAPWAELTEVPLMAAVFVVMVWHAQRHRRAVAQVRLLADRERAAREREHELLRDASHLLRTPITIARGHAELLLDETHEDGSRDDARCIVGELATLSRIADQLLTLTQIAGEQSLRLRSIDIPALLVQTAGRWSAAAARSWVVETNELPGVWADGDRLACALDALVENAVAFTAGGDQITLSCRRVGGAAVIEVTDCGPGVAAEHLPRVFDRFYRADSSHPGHGLGLAIVQAVAAAHGGVASVENVPGSGARFALRLPAAVPGELLPT